MEKRNRNREAQEQQLNEFDKSTAKERIDRIDAYGFERSTDFDYDAYEEFMSVYLAILTRRSIKWSKLLKGNKKVGKSLKVKRYVRKGIPNEHRSLVWMVSSGAQAQMDQNPGYYSKLLNGEKDAKLVDAINTGGDLLAAWRSPEDQQGIMDIGVFMQSPAGCRGGHRRELQGGPRASSCPVTRKFVTGRATDFRVEERELLPDPEVIEDHMDWGLRTLPGQGL
ncbi:GRT1A protein, partial [Polypterus senegalus]